MNNNLIPGDVIKDRYKIKEIIGQGGMGSVFLADDSRLAGRLCALKAVHYEQNLPEDVIKQTRKQFKREATVLAMLDHPNLPKVSDFFSDENIDYLVMDYVPGKDLRTLMQEEKKKEKFLTERVVLNWASQIADALIYLHSQTPVILHRDIKPSNIKLTPNGIIKLVDFGLVKLLVSGEKTITVVHGHGSAYYTPLEQYGGDTGHTDPRSDVYSFGSTLYHLLTNKAPLEARQRFLESAEVQLISDINKGISPRTERAIVHAMYVHPDKRIQSVEEFKEALLGDWNPRQNPNGAMPAPNIWDLIKATEEQVLTLIALLMFMSSIVATLMK
ncbi:MAG: serine/threonine protein kinase [Anaerolineales bacterium]|nr:serine/threonine protein kinase [Anaerolineales bacterium]